MCTSNQLFDELTRFFFQFRDNDEGENNFVKLFQNIIFHQFSWNDMVNWTLQVGSNLPIPLYEIIF